MENRLENIEMHFGYLQKTVDELSGVVLEQGKEIRELRRLVQDIYEKFHEISAAQTGVDPNEKPPHY